MAVEALLHTHCPTLTLIATGKVRDIYAVPGHPEALLFVATDRVSAFDVSMLNVSRSSVVRPAEQEAASPDPARRFHPNAGNPRQGQAAHGALPLLLPLPRQRARYPSHPEPCDHVGHR